jgi:outer membrane protein assembly factor BamE (lipoprotein component of BamABCDE complex)
MKSTSQKIKLILALMLFFTAKLVGYTRWAVVGHGFNLNDFEKIKVGMNIQDVRELMGEPSSVRRTKNGSIVYNYGCNLKWCMGIIYFDKKKQVESVWHDH